MKSDLLKWLIGVGVAALTAYYTTIMAINVSLMEVKTTERLHHESTNAKIDSVASDVRQIRDAVYVVASRTQRIEKEVK